MNFFKTKHQNNSVQTIVPILNVKSVAKSIEYYVEKLGFKEDWTWEDPATFASVSRNGHSIFFCENGQGAAGTWMSVFVENVDTLFEEYQEKGVTIREQPTNCPWGVREMNVEDLDGHRIRFGTSIED